MFSKLYIQYLGLVILEDQVEINLIKVAKVCNWPILTICMKLQMFLSFTNFYQRFIYSFYRLLLNIIESNSI